MAEISLIEFTMPPDSDGKVRSESYRHMVYIPDWDFWCQKSLLPMALRLLRYDVEE